MAQAYCVKDKQKVEIKNPQQITMKNGKPATEGKCPTCGSKVERLKEESYYFRLSKYQQPLLDFYAANPEFLQPGFRLDRKSTRLNSSHSQQSRMPSSA